MIKIRCPNCRHKLAFNEKKEIGEMLERRYYGCIRCLRQFERLILRDGMGLIKTDQLYELDVNGNHIRVWK